MNGFKLITELMTINYSQIAKEMSVSPQYIQQLAKGVKEIPDSKKDQLSQIINIDKKYFENKLNENDQLQLMELLLSRKIGRQVEIKFK